VYRRAAVVLNDHWAEQNDAGLVNNRIFDALACDTPVLSDANSGIQKIFGDALPTYHDFNTFAKQLEALTKENSDAHDMAKQLGEMVRRTHTFDQRAARIHEAVKYLVMNYVEYKSEMLWAARRKGA
jgi:spore maturation protein CgeB